MGIVGYEAAGVKMFLDIIGRVARVATRATPEHPTGMMSGGRIERRSGPARAAGVDSLL